MAAAPKFLSTLEVAEHAGHRERVVRRAISAGLLQPPRCGHVFVFAKSDVPEVKAACDKIVAQEAAANVNSQTDTLTMQR